jgi:hypothetical protein
MLTRRNYNKMPNKHRFVIYSEKWSKRWQREEHNLQSEMTKRRTQFTIRDDKEKNTIYNQRWQREEHNLQSEIFSVVD